MFSRTFKEETQEVLPPHLKRIEPEQQGASQLRRTQVDERQVLMK